MKRNQKNKKKSERGRIGHQQVGVKKTGENGSRRWKATENARK